MFWEWLNKCEPYLKWLAHRMHWYYLLVVFLQALIVVLYATCWGDRSHFVVWCKSMALAANIFIILGFISHVTSCHDRLRHKQALFLIFVLLFFAGALFGLSFATLSKEWFTVHFALVSVAALLYLLCDLILATAFLTADDNAAGLRYVLSLDIPNVVAFAVLLILYWPNQGLPGMYEFVSGAIAFQWLASNVIFVILQFRHHVAPPNVAAPNGTIV